MLNIRQTKHLFEALQTTDAEIRKVIESPRDFYQELELRDPHKPDKVRIVVNVVGMMRAYQLRLYRRILLPKLEPSVHSHGGVRGRSIKTNVQPHIGSAYVFKTDISNFYPSIHYRRVYRIFNENLGCSPDVARICTLICTHKHHLALGLITSPILADQVLKRVDRRIGGACAKVGLTYTRYVDDVAISGPFNLERSGFASLVEKILADDGFKVNSAKHKFGTITGGVSVTNLREVNGHLDVRKEYFDELIRQLNDAASLANDGEFTGPYYTPGQILGRVRFVSWVNPGRRRDLIQRFRSIRWSRVRAIARQRKYEKCVTTVQPRQRPTNGTQP